MTLGLPPGIPTFIFAVRPIEPSDHDAADPTCPRCDRAIYAYDDHATGCPNWGMLPEHWK